MHAPLDHAWALMGWTMILALMMMAYYVVVIGMGEVNEDVVAAAYGRDVVAVAYLEVAGAKSSSVVGALGAGVGLAEHFVDMFVADSLQKEMDVDQAAKEDVLTPLMMI